MPFPNIDPVIFEIGPLAIRWYAMAYIAGLLIGWRYVLRLIAYDDLRDSGITRDHIDDFFLWAMLGVIIGARLGYVLFYNFGYYSQNPADIFAVWQGGMSYHGGVIGVALAILYFSYKHDLPLFSLGDIVVAAAPIGLFFGRLANFINAELWGRPTDVPWGVIFPGAGDAPRHPSQLYEAAFEGLILFILLYILIKYFNALRRPGILLGTFFCFYATARFFIEFYRAPDAHIGFLFGSLSTGQILCILMLPIGLFFLGYGMKHTAPSHK